MTIGKDRVNLFYYSPEYSPCRRGTDGTVGSRAFTLIEIMLAIAIFSLVIAAIYSSWFAIMRGAKTGKEAAVQAQRTRMAMNSVVDSLLCAQMFNMNPDLYAFMVDNSDEYSFLSFVAQLPPSFPDSGLFGGLKVRRVNFEIRSDEDGEQALFMSQQPILAELKEDEEPVTVRLISDVSMFSVELWDERRDEWSDEWRNTNQLPTLVMVTLGLGEKDSMAGGAKEVYSRVVNLPAIAVSPQMQVMPPQDMPAGGNNVEDIRQRRNQRIQRPGQTPRRRPPGRSGNSRNTIRR
ncbi:MAG: prepilin-type N-terminal cleavage/methylation domain-containing protein [Verrucomicrobia bacterium]|nr:prepilin-type N-terminal cleavage/methylation domain-containing protein [Verrucomicrobiota bacterium]MCF7707313.1 prepilin-type N-terminal cleavage/methylation domain-containing protein [Verrucomicrobiota bacterium]